MRQYLIKDVQIYLIFQSRNPKPGPKFLFYLVEYFYFCYF